MNREKFLILSDGSLVMRDSGKTVRALFSRLTREIKTGAEFRAALRAGLFAWPGGYAGAFLLSDGELLCPECAKENARQIIAAIRARDSSGWRAVGVTWEHETDETETCAHCARELLNAREAS